MFAAIRQEKTHTSSVSPRFGGTLAILLCAVASCATAADEGVVDSTPASPSAPKAEVKQILHHFGVMQPNEVASHEFVVKNTGSSPLELREPKGSCRCLRMRVSKRVLQPGEEGVVYVRWRAAEKKGESFKQTVRVQTNDPNQKVLEFVVAGEVGGHIQLTPGRVLWKNAKPGQSRTAVVHVSSSYWPEMHVAKLTASEPGVEVELEGESNASRRGESTRSVRVTLPEEATLQNVDALVTMVVSRAPLSEQELQAFAEQGRAGFDGTHAYEGSLDADNPAIDSAGTKNDRPTVIQIPVAFELAPVLSLSGAGYSALRNTMYFGAQSTDEEVTAKLLIKLSDPVKDLKLVKASVVPESLEPQLEPYRPEKGLYRLTLRFPPNSIDRAYVGSQAGSVELEFDHPRAKRLKFSVEVSPRL